VSEICVSKRVLLTTTNLHVNKHKTIANIRNMVVFTHTITEEYWASTLVISVLDAERGRMKIFTVSPVQEIIPLSHN